ncbi:unnamed protein product, partial [Ixodes pacificus]
SCSRGLRDSHAQSPPSRTPRRRSAWCRRRTSRAPNTRSGTLHKRRERGFHVPVQERAVGAQALLEPRHHGGAAARHPGALAAFLLRHEHNPHPAPEETQGR